VSTGSADGLRRQQSVQTIKQVKRGHF
jgi:hypothetical protein